MPGIKKLNKQTKTSYNLNEESFDAFKALDLLVESEAFDITNPNEVELLNKFIENDKEDPIEMITDLEAEDKEELKDTYVGDIILQCPVCHEMIYKKEEDIVYPENAEDSEDEEEILVNEDEECPICRSDKGFRLIGKVAPLEDIEKESEEEIVEPEEKEVVEIEDEKDIEEENLKESFEDEIIELTEEDLEMINYFRDNLSDERKEIFDTFTDAEKLLLANSEDIGFWFDEIAGTEYQEEYYKLLHRLGMTEDGYYFDEESFDDLAERYLKETYENVETYKTSDISYDKKSKSIIIEGIINFKNSKKGKTSFIFENLHVTPNKKIILKGSNKSINENLGIFNLKLAKKGNKLITERFLCNYIAKNELNESIEVNKKFYR